MNLKLREAPKIEITQLQSSTSHPHESVEIDINLNESRISNRRRNENSKIFDAYKPRRSVSPHIRDEVDQIHLKRSSVLRQSAFNIRKEEDFHKGFNALTEQNETDHITDELVKFKNQKRSNEFDLGNKPNGFFKLF